MFSESGTAGSPARPRPAPAVELAAAFRQLPALPCLTGFAAGAALGTTVFPGLPLVGLLTLLGGAVAAAAGIAARPAVVALAVAALLFGVARSEVPPSDAGLQQRADQLAGLPADLEGTVVSDPAPTAAGYRLLLQPSRIEATGRLAAGTSVAPAGLVEVEVTRGDQPLQGDLVDFSGTLELPADSPGFAWREYLAAQGAYLEVIAGGITIEHPAQGAAAWASAPARLRALYVEAVDAVLPQPAAAILIGVVLGVREGIPASVTQDLTDTGLIHLLVLSGLKVALFSRLVLALLRPLLGRRATWIALALILLYCLVGGATPAAVRACGMGGLALVAERLGRQTQVWASLAALAAAMLAWSPTLTLDTGFQLSFLGTGAIILFTPTIERPLRALPAVVREPLAVTIAAQIGTAPVLASGFGLLSPISPLANALVLPLLPALIGGGLAIAPLALVPAAGHWLALPVSALIQFLEQVAALLARVPGAVLRTPGVALPVALAYYLAVGAGLIAVHTDGGRRRAAIAVGLLGPLLVVGVEAGVWAHPGPQANVLAIGAGQATLLRGPEGLILVDGGPEPATLAAQAGQHLAPWERTLTALVVTGGGTGHVDGLERLPFTVGAVYAPAGGLTGGAWEEPVAAAAGEGAALHTLAAGDQVHVAGLLLQALSPEPDQPPGGQLALRVVGPDHTFCDLADLPPGEQAIAAGRLRGRCDTVLVPDQGATVPSSAFLAAARPSTLLVSDAPGTRLGSGFPQAEVRRTSQEGDLTVPL